MKKYEITDIAHPDNPNLHRIRAVTDLTEDVLAGMLGGYVESYDNLDQEGRAWISEDAIAGSIRQRHPSFLSFKIPAMTLALQWAGWTWRGVAVWDKVASRPQKGRFRQQSEYIVWGSNGKMPLERNVGCLPGVFRYPNPQNRIHVTEKPLQLMRDVVQICEPGGRILDPFAGAGTTVLAAVQEGYEAVGIEMSDAYFRRSAERLKTALESEVNQN